MTKIVAINVRNDRSTRTHALTAILQELQFEMMKVNVRLLWPFWQQLLIAGVNTLTLKLQIGFAVDTLGKRGK